MKKEQVESAVNVALKYLKAVSCEKGGIVINESELEKIFHKTIKTLLQSQKWEIEFEKFLPDYGNDIINKPTTATEIMIGESEKDRRNNLKNFISILLQSQKQEFIKIVEKELDIYPVLQSKIIHKVNKLKEL
jgi:hypothetical protein